jgi:hypothetical protein
MFQTLPLSIIRSFSLCSWSGRLARPRTTKLRCSPDQPMALSENGKTTANQQNTSHHCTLSTVGAVTPPNVGVIFAAPYTLIWNCMKKFVFAEKLKLKSKNPIQHKKADCRNALSQPYCRKPINCFLFPRQSRNADHSFNEKVHYSLSSFVLSFLFNVPNFAYCFLSCSCLITHLRVLQTDLPTVLYKM